ncbi:Hypothetical predicted protein, partial [Pelobates cultripes]
TTSSTSSRPKTQTRNTSNKGAHTPPLHTHWNQTYARTHDPTFNDSSSSYNSH